MIKTLKDTTSAKIQAAISDGRNNVGAASALVFTMLVVADTSDYDAVFDACVEAGREHPSRIILVADGSSRADRLDAEVHLGEGVPGEILALKFHGELAEHKYSTLLPLLLPDSPVIAWWPGTAPVSLAEDPVGRLARRRISDAMGARRPLDALMIRAKNLTPGDTDLTWTRLTPWRALLAAALDQHPVRVLAAEVQAAENNAAGLLLAAWLRSRLQAPVTFVASEGPGITQISLSTEAGEIRITRTDGKMASFTAPRTPSRSVALRRRDISALITEELRRLDADEVFSSAMRCLAADFEDAAARPRASALRGSRTKADVE